MRKCNLYAYTYENYFLKLWATQSFCKISSLIPSICPSAHPSACLITVFINRNDKLFLYIFFFCFSQNCWRLTGPNFPRKFLSIQFLVKKGQTNPKTIFDAIFENIYHYHFLKLIKNERPYYCYFRAGHISGKIESIKLSASLKCDILWTKFCISWFFCKQIKIPHTAQKMKFFIKDFFSKWDQIRRKLQI